MKTIVSQQIEENRTLSVHTEHELLLKLEKAGLNSRLAQRIIDSKDNELGKKLVKFIENGGYGSSVSQNSAREIMGRNFFGIEEAVKYFGYPSKRQLSVLSQIPFTEETLVACKATHVLIAVFPMSIVSIYKHVGRRSDPVLFFSDNGFIKKEFANDRGVVGWQLVSKLPTPDSASNTWNDQLVLLSDTDEATTARIVLYTMVGYFLNTREPLFCKGCVRCNDLESTDCRVYVGYDDHGGILIGHWFEESKSECLSLLSVKKR